MSSRLWLSCLAVAAAGCPKKEDPKPAPEATPVVVEKKSESAPAAIDDHAKLLERGAYVAKLTGCITCHTAAGPTGPDLEHMGAGGLEMPDPAGTWHTPNITPDKTTGIGNWTDDQIILAVREGTRPDGQQMYSIMPYAMLNRMTDADAKALVAFLRTIKPVERVIAPNKGLKFPKLTMPKAANEPDGVGDPLKHGEYLATLMLCGHCHMTPTAGPMTPDHRFTGGLEMTIPALGTGKLYASNITSDPDTGIGKWSEDQIFTTLKTMVRPDGRMINPPMLMLQAGWSQIDDSDLRAVAKWVHTIPPVKNKIPASNFKMTMPGDPPAGSAAH